MGVLPRTGERPADLGPGRLRATDGRTPFRVAEFDDLFAQSLRRVEPVSPTYLRLVLAASAESTARDLAERESSCCSFFTFALSRLGDELGVDVQVPGAQVAVLDALAARALSFVRA